MATSRWRADSGGSRRLVDLLTRYGGAIERDLFDRGWLLSELFARRQFRLLLNIIDGLPRTSAYLEAVANDDETIERNLEAYADQPSHGPRLSEYGPTEELLAAMYDRLGEVIQAVVGTAPGGKPPKFAPWRRPQLGIDRVQSKQAREENRELLARLLPHQVSEDPTQ